MGYIFPYRVNDRAVVTNILQLFRAIGCVLGEFK